MNRKRLALQANERMSGHERVNNDVFCIYGTVKSNMLESKLNLLRRALRRYIHNVFSLLVINASIYIFSIQVPFFSAQFLVQVFLKSFFFVIIIISFQQKLLFSIDVDRLIRRNITISFTLAVLSDRQKKRERMLCFIVASNTIEESRDAWN